MYKNVEEKYSLLNFYLMCNEFKKLLIIFKQIFVVQLFQSVFYRTAFNTNLRNFVFCIMQTSLGNDRFFPPPAFSGNNNAAVHD